MANLKPWKTLIVQPYDRRLRVYRSREALDYAMKRVGYDTEGQNDTVLGVCWRIEEGGGVEYLIGWFDGRRSTLVHELGHLCFQIISGANMNPADSNGEAFCYLLDHLAQQLGIDR